MDLIYEKFFLIFEGKDLVKLFVKVIVNKNIESGLNVEIVVDVFWRRCGSFCSFDDVVIFKVQEQFKRVLDQYFNGNQFRMFFYESLCLFEKVVGSFIFVNFYMVVMQFIELKYYVGVIQFCFVVVCEKDCGNIVLSWINDGKFIGDFRVDVFNEWKCCYDLIYDVFIYLDEVLS